MSDGGEGEGRAKKRSFVSRLSRKLPNPLRRSRPDSDEEGVPPIPETPSQEIPEDAASTPLHVGERPTTSEREGAFKTKFSDTEGSGGVSGAGVTRMVNMSSDHATDDTPAPLLRSERGIRSARTAASSTGGVSGVDAIPKKRDAPAVYGVAEIVLTGVKGVPKEVLKMLRERGFVVHLAMTYEEVEPAALTVVLALGPKLMKKCAIERKLPVKAREQYSPGEVSELCAHAIKVIYRSGLKFDQVDLLHDKDALAEVMKAERADVVDAVNSYFGPYFGLYFAWLSFYTRALIIPAVGGLLLWLWQWGSGTPDGPYLPISCVVLMFWATVFLELWRRRNREIAYRWGVDGVEDDENMRVVAEKGGEYKPAPIGKFFVTVPIICGAIYAIIRIMLYCTWLSDNALEVYGEESYMKYLAHVLHAVVPLVAGSLYGSLAKVLNNYEEHPTQVQRKNMLVMKMFAFQFVNSYCALFYVAFWLRDLDRLRALLTTMMLVKQFVAQLREKYQPRIYTWWRHRNEEKEPKEPRYVVKHEGTVTPEEVLRELTAGPGTVEDDYLEMVLQFGYVAMFAAVYPLAPLTAIVNNLWEFRLDLNILGTTRRPKAQAESRIGAWELCLEVICVVACLTNILLALVVSDNASAYVPASLSEQLGSTEGKVILAVVVEHSMLLLKAVINGLVDDQPRVVREAKMAAAVKDLEKEKNAKRVASGLAVSKGGVSSPGVELSPKNRLQHLHKTYGVWGINPMWYLPLAALPFVVARLEMSAWWILPVAVVILGYLQHRKDKASAALALGIVKDPKVLKLVTDFLPAWYKESDFERMEWCNRILDKLWVPASAATREVLFANVQPLLESYRPSGISALGLRKVTLGTIPPKVVGVRTLGMTGNKAAIDLDLRWAGNAEFVLEAGVKPVPLVITLDKIRFSGRMRVELAPLVPVFPCFGAIVFTFLEKPFLDFSFSLGKLDVMSIGPGEASVGAAVSNMIRNILNGMMVFPKKMVIPILPEQDVMGLSNPVPKGVVQVVVVGADNLPKADLTGKSDPYVKIAVGQAEKAKTDVKSNTLSPRWNEIFDMLVYEPSVEVIRFNVMDQDTTGEDDSLGHCELPISMLKEGEESAHNIALSGAKSGSLLIKTTFVPLSSGPAPEVGVDADGDVILSLAGDAITDDTVASDDQGAPAGTVGAKPPKSQKSEDPSKLPPTVVNADDSMGVLTIMGIECKGVKKGDRYVSVIVGNTKRKTPVEKGKSSFAYSDVFHFLVKGAKSATVEVLLKEDETIRRNRVVGSFKLYVAEVMANEDELDGEWDLTGEDAQGSIKMRLKWSGRASGAGTA